MTAIDWLNKELKKTNTSIQNAESKPNVCQDELSNLREKASILNYLISLAQRDRDVENRLSEAEKKLKNGIEEDYQEAIKVLDYHRRKQTAAVEEIIYGEP